MNARPARSGVRKSPATIWDVARAAGVSVGTVSKALNGQGQLRDETRTAVRSTAERLGFRPNDLAQSLLRKRTFTVGLISTDSYGRFSIPVLEGIESALEPARISVFLCRADDPVRERREGFRDGLGTAGLRARPGHVLSGPWSEAHGRAAAQRLMAARPAVDAIFCGSDQIARGVIDSLRDLGVRVPDDIAVVG